MMAWHLMHAAHQVRAMDAADERADERDSACMAGVHAGATPQPTSHPLPAAATPVHARACSLPPQHGEEMLLPSGFICKAFPTTHSVPSQGYLLYRCVRVRVRVRACGGRGGE